MTMERPIVPSVAVGPPQMKAIMKELGGRLRRYRNPYRVHLDFPYKIIDETEV